MVCFGIRSKDGSYEAHANMMRERFHKEEAVSVMPGRIDKIGDDLWVVQLNILFAQPIGIINTIYLIAFLFTWIVSGFNTTMAIIGTISTISILCKDYLWFGIFYIAAHRRYGAKHMSYVNHETLISEAFTQWDKTKS